MPEYFVGLMSGTSLDGVDGVIADFEGPQPRVIAHASATFDPELRSELLALNTAGTDELHRGALAANALVKVYAQVVRDLLDESKTDRSAVRAIGAHGQTVRHRPGAFDGVGYTIQLSNPALLAELCGIDVVADFRSRDVAAGGQGAPLAPFFHRAVFTRSGESVAVLNIGGISNLSVIQGDGSMIGFDCGPGNALMDSWCLGNLGQAFDDAGRWAATGTVEARLLAAMLSDNYFALPPPKSTGRDLFNDAWLQRQLAAHGSTVPKNIQATLADLTASACAQSVERYAASIRRLVVCGGGALNDHLMRRLAALLPGVRVMSSAECGLPPLQVEAAAFAWLARKTLRREKLDLESTTGARGARVLGCVYPA